MTRKEYQHVQWLVNHKINDDGVIERQCSKCGEWIEENIDNFYYKNKSFPERGFGSECRKCAILRSGKYQDENRDERKAYDKQRYIDKRDYFFENAYRWQGENKEKVREDFRRWCSENPEKLRDYWDKRKHKEHIVSDSEWESCKKYFIHRCAYCGLPIEENYFTRRGITKLGDFHKEHWDDEGSVYLENCVPSCGSCNSFKHLFKFNEWYTPDNPIYNAERFNTIMKWITEDHKKYMKPKREKRKYNIKSK